ncbi:hypothetical protein ABK040_004597 [Willaertia magna]
MYNQYETTKQWDNFEINDNKEYNELLKNRFYNLNDQIKKNEKELGFALRSYKLMIRRIKYEINNKLKINNKRLFNNIELTVIHPRFFYYFNTNNNELRYTTKYGIKEIWSVLMMFEGGLIKRKLECFVNFIRLYINYTTLKVMMEFDFKVNSIVLENTFKLQIPNCVTIEVHRNLIINNYLPNNINSNENNLINNNINNNNNIINSNDNLINNNDVFLNENNLFIENRNLQYNVNSLYLNNFNNNENKNLNEFTKKNETIFYSEKEKQKRNHILNDFKHNLIQKNQWKINDCYKENHIFNKYTKFYKGNNHYINIKNSNKTIEKILCLHLSYFFNLSSKYSNDYFIMKSYNTKGKKDMNFKNLINNPTNETIKQFKLLKIIYGINCLLFMCFGIILYELIIQLFLFDFELCKNIFKIIYDKSNKKKELKSVKKSFNENEMKYQLLIKKQNTIPEDI